MLGVICPGINQSIINLNKSTALLPLISLKKDKIHMVRILKKH